MSKGYLFIGGPEHGTYRAVERPDIPVHMVELADPDPTFRYSEPVDDLRPVQTRVTTYQRFQMGLHSGREGLIRGVFAPETMSGPQVEALLREFLFQEWIKASPDSRQVL